MKPDEVVLRFINSIGRPAEAAQYVSLFRAAQRERFAIIAISDTVMSVEPGALVTDLRFLARLGLAPVIVVGLTGSGKRDHAESLRDRLAPTVTCELVPSSVSGITQRITDVARAKNLPIVTMGGGATLDERFEKLQQLVTALQTRKLIFVGRRSGLQARGRPTPSLVDVTTELDALAAPGILPTKQAALLARIGQLFAQTPHRLTVSITSPLDLLRELFTERGAGTLLRKGATVVCSPDYATLDERRLATLIDHAFGRQLAPDFFTRPTRAIYLADDYRGAAIVTESPLGPYLSKFAVDLQARGEGVGRDLWRAMERELPSLVWRSRSRNPINTWYGQLADGVQRGPQWHVFWRDIATARIPQAIDYARDLPADFSDD